MKTATAQVRTDKASRYVAQLCKHFSHRVPAEWNETEGLVRFEPGACRMSASDGTLTLMCESETEKALAVVQDVVADHLVRFAWKEELSVTWTQGESNG
ncbi:MAG: DUF2218 domain-containing protein [Thalassobaculaceae bacterium]|nr:DUF2218 domain-containing protein [Thalassobaculaceae bacterium]